MGKKYKTRSGDDVKLLEINLEFPEEYKVIGRIKKQDRVHVYQWTLAGHYMPSDSDYEESPMDLVEVFDNPVVWQYRVFAKGGVFYFKWHDEGNGPCPHLRYALRKSQVVGISSIEWRKKPD